MKFLFHCALYNPITVLYTAVLGLSISDFETTTNHNCNIFNIHSLIATKSILRPVSVFQSGFNLH